MRATGRAGAKLERARTKLVMVANQGELVDENNRGGDEANQDQLLFDVVKHCLVSLRAKLVVRHVRGLAFERASYLECRDVAAHA